MHRKDILGSSTFVEKNELCTRTLSGGATPDFARANTLYLGGNTSVLAEALAVKSCNNKFISQDILTDDTNNLPMPCHEQRIGAAAVYFAIFRR